MRLHLSIVALGVACISSAAAQEMPPRRVGLWEITMTEQGTNTAPQVMQQCIDAKTDQMMNPFSGSISAQMCSKHDVQKVGAMIVINAECQMGPVKTVSRSVVSGDFNSNYTVETTTKMEGLPAAAQAQVGGGKRTIQARWAGACKADQRPGDMVLPDGRKMNILDMKKMMGRAKPPQQK